ncbi:N-acetyltransferase [Chloropicon primus]|uniref:N-acetyltransferase 9-like protein n=2 Tax=Chloropicon primus TaxID=1764295 RepID=A0A5B8MBK7_9CHLO|nr:N-acetyltransferase [Chloropicon primus]|eukprot:QDZ17737.1 N-acetyltransferase [Chloropicon primus]
MKANANLVIEGVLVKLVPYREEHVPKYHEWMQDPRLLEATASEPLSLEQEYDMQKSWREDEDKCTFIVLDKALPSEPGLHHGAGMAGDVNLFFNEPDGKDVAEIEVMIAEDKSRRKGLALEAVRMMIRYAATELKCTKFVAKIGESNLASLSLFNKLGFREVKRVEVFNEVHKELKVTPELLDGLQSVKYQQYDEKR